MSDARFGDMTVDGFLEAMGSKEPTPGGGAAAAIAGATGAALIAMVGRLDGGQARARRTSTSACRRSSSEPTAPVRSSSPSATRTPKRSRW